jgi:hypothetical protein
VGPRVGLDAKVREKNPLTSAGDQTSIARSSSPWSDTTLNELPQLLSFRYTSTTLLSLAAEVIYQHLRAWILD